MRPLRAAIWFGLALTAFAPLLAPRETAAASAGLSVGVPQILRIPAASEHSLHVRLPAGFFARLHLDSRGFPATIGLRDPDGRTLVSERRVPPGVSSCSWIGRSSGDYRVSLRSEGGLDARIRLEMTTARPAAPGDALAVDGERALETAASDETPGSGEALNVAIERRLAASEGEGPCEAVVTHRRAAALKRELGAVTEAVSLLEKAVKESARCGRPRLVASSFVELASVRLAEGRFEDSGVALDRATKAIPTAELDLAGDIELGWAQLENLRIRTALSSQHNERARSLYRENGDAVGEARAWLWLAYNYISAGAPESALEAGAAALKLGDDVGDRRARGRVLQALGLASQSLGRTQRALELYLEARNELSAGRDAAERAAVFNGLAELYLEAGAFDRALEFARLAAELNQAIPSALADSLCMLARAHYSSGHHEDAERNSARALAIYKELGDPKRSALAQRDLARAARASGHAEAAIPHLREALAVLEDSGANYLKALALSDLGEALADQGLLAEATLRLEQALSLQREVGSVPDEVLVLANLARLRAKTGHLPEALLESTRALAQAEELRAALASYDLRTSYFSSVSEFRAFHIDLLMRLHAQQPQRGYDVQAFQASELSRARTLVEVLTESVMPPSRGRSDELLRTEREVASRLDQLARRIASRTDALEGEVDRLARQYTQARAEHDQLESAIRAADRRYAVLGPPEGLTLEGIQSSLLDEDTALVEYFLGSERSFAWVVARGSFASFVLPPKDAIASLVQRVNELVRSPLTREGESVDAYFSRVQDSMPRFGRVAQELSDVLFTPYLRGLPQRRILLVTHDALHHLPFAALPWGRDRGSRPVLASHEIVRIPSAATLSALRRSVPGPLGRARDVLVLADPVFSTTDPRVRGEGLARAAERQTRGGLDLTRLTRLVASGQEAREIVLTAGPEKVRVLSGFAARRDSVLGAALGEHGIVHFASHSFVDDQHPELSAVVLSMVDEAGASVDGLLLLNDVYAMKLSAELVVLSACDTALGKEIRGEGILSLTRGFFHAGAKRVIASLWKVDDRATLELMRRFYAGLFRDGLAPGAALRQAQLAMSADPRWAFPFYWSGFELHGEWR